MVPFDARRRSGEVVSITLESLVWFFIVTTAATFAGTYVYGKYEDLQGSTPAPGSKTTT